MKSSIAAGFLCLVLGPAAVLSIVWTLNYVGRGDYLSAVVTLGFAAFALGMVGMTVVVGSRRVTPRITRDGTATALRPDRKVDGLLMISTVGGFVAMATYALFAPLGMLDIEVLSGSQRLFAALCAIAVLLGLTTLRQMIRQRGTNYLRMSLDGLVMGNTMTSVERSWDEITDIADRPRSGNAPTGTTYLTAVDGRTRVIPTDWYTPGGGAVRDLMRFYWQHTPLREELADGRAAKRFQSNSWDIR